MYGREIDHSDSILFVQSVVSSKKYFFFLHYAEEIEEAVSLDYLLENGINGQACWEYMYNDGL
jgi:hypothetical protein